MTEQGGGEAGRPAARTGYRRGGLGQVFLALRQFPAEAGAEGDLDSPGKLLKRQAPRKKVIAKRCDSLLAFGIRATKGRIVHVRHARRRPGRAATACTSS